MALPNFLVIGAPKAGTTALYHYLRQHPGVFMPELKEPRFFALEGSEAHADDAVNRRTIRDLEDYIQLFDRVTDQRAVGEASPVYLGSERAPGRIHELMPDARLIAILRHPAERAHSHFLFAARKGFEPDGVTFEEAISTAAVEVGGYTRRRPYLEDGFYARHLRRYRQLFRPEQMLVLFFEDLQRDPRGVLERVYAFLGVDETFEATPEERHHAKAGIPRIPALNRLLGGSSVLGRKVARVLPRQFVRTMRLRLLNMNLARPEMSPETRQRLISIYREDVLELQELTGRDLSAWLR